MRASVCAAPGKKFARNSARETFSRAAVGGVPRYCGVGGPSQGLRMDKDGRSLLPSRAPVPGNAREPSPAPPLPRSLPSVPRQQSLKQPRKKRKSLEIPGLPIPREREPRWTAERGTAEQLCIANSRYNPVTGTSYEYCSCATRRSSLPAHPAHCGRPARRC